MLMVPDSPLLLAFPNKNFQDWGGEQLSYSHKYFIVENNKRIVIKNIRGYNMEIGADKVYCFSCGEVIKAEAEICPRCGVRQKTNPLCQMKNPGVAAIASFFFAGLGQIYNGEIGKGLLLIIVQTVNVFLIFLFIGLLTYPIVWIYGIYDAYTTAEKINVEMIR